MNLCMLLILVLNRSVMLMDMAVSMENAEHQISARVKLDGDYKITSLHCNITHTSCKGLGFLNR